jgi:hypothetical protein
MLRKLTLGLVAAASLSAMALAPSAASPHSWGGAWGGYHHFRGSHIGYIAGPAYVSTAVAMSRAA